MPKTGYIGIDVGGTKTRLSLFDAKFRVVEDIKLKTLGHDDAAAFTNAVSDFRRTIP